MYCPKCYIEIPDDSAICKSCGAQVTPELAESAEQENAPEGSLENAPENAPESAPESASESAPESAPAVRRVREDYPFGSLGEAWSIITGNLGEYLLAALIVVVPGGIVNLVLRLLINLPAAIVGGILDKGGDEDKIIGHLIRLAAELVGLGITIVVVSPLQVGLTYFILKKIRNETARLGDIFAGFTKFLIPSIATGLGTSLLIMIGLVFAVIPGALAAVACMFAYFLVADGERSVTQAIVRSKDLVMPNFLMNLLFLMLIGAIYWSGYAACCVGILFTQPFMLIALALVYNEYIGKGSAKS